jgi:hypothetical protein
MEPQKTLLSYAVDIAQIVSAFATAGAVIVAVWLARRGEAQRPKLFGGWRDEITVSMVSGGSQQKMSVSLTVVNAGMMPIRIENAGFKAAMRTGHHWSTSLTKSQRPPVREFPVTLQHGENITFYVEIRQGVAPWTNLHPNWFKWYAWSRPRFYISTSLGKVYERKVDRETLERMKEFLEVLPHT